MCGGTPSGPATRTTLSRPARRVLTCPNCGGAGEPVPQGRGRPRLDDKRKPRGGFNDAEWEKVKALAAAAGMTAAAYLRKVALPAA